MKVDGFDKLEVCWSDFLNDTFTAVNNFMGKGYDSVYPIGVGGHVVAAIVSDYLDIPIDNVSEGNCLLVTDVIDSGVVLRYGNSLGFDSLSVYVKEGTVFSPNWYGKLVSNDLWLVFPWENPLDARHKWECKMIEDKCVEEGGV